MFVARQLVKHKFLRWNEISRRYVDTEPEFYEPDSWRGRSEDKKQGSEGIVQIYMDQGMQWYRQMTAYENLINNGILVCPEQARMLLPQSMMTEWYWSGSLDAFADMCNLRCASDTQLETRIVANGICNKMKYQLFPVSWFKGRHKCQFSWYCDGKSDKAHEELPWARALIVADNVLRGKIKDPTKGATHYHARYVKPYWSASLNNTVIYGSHKFYQ